MTKPSFFESQLCQGRRRCWQCRTNEVYRQGINVEFDVPSVDFECPFGITEKSLSEDDKELSILERAKNLSVAVKDVAVDAAKRKKVMTKKDEATKRLDMCRSCKFYNKGICGKCGCVMAVKTKIKESRCPVGKW
jgi:hypothetical protein